jgi:AraC-like DNA-binding protein
MTTPLHTLRHDSPLGTWEFSCRAPGPRLAPHAKLLWDTRGSTAYSHDKILPDGLVVLIVNLGVPQKLHDPWDYSKFTWFRRAWISGLQDEALVTGTGPGSHLVGVHLDPLGAYRLTGIPAHELSRSVFELSSIFGREFDDLGARLAALPNAGARLDAFEQHLALRIEEGPSPRREVAHALHRIRATRGAVEIRALAREAGFSPKHLLALFRREVGLGPKVYARIVRFDHVAQALRADPQANMGRLAHEAGYSDQSHFVREFSAFSGAPPSEIAARFVPDGGGVWVG